MSKVDRNWGYYKVLHTDGPGIKVKELTVDPGKRLSLQHHALRSEFWFVAHGTATVYTLNSSSVVELIGVYDVHQSLLISRNQWHQLANESTEPLRLIEIQYGKSCDEDDIVRMDLNG
jgi:mannose-6-phosphate isomerase-like protein (cupin superfamily)